MLFVVENNYTMIEGPGIILEIHEIKLAKKI